MGATNQEQHLKEISLVRRNVLPKNLEHDFRHLGLHI